MGSTIATLMYSVQYTFYTVHCTMCFCLLLRGNKLLWLDLVPGDLMETSRIVPSAFIGSNFAHPTDGAAEKNVFGLILKTSW